MLLTHFQIVVSSPEIYIYIYIKFPTQFCELHRGVSGKFSTLNDFVHHDYEVLLYTHAQ